MKKILLGALTLSLLTTSAIAASSKKKKKKKKKKQTQSRVVQPSRTTTPAKNVKPAKSNSGKAMKAALKAIDAIADAAELAELNNYLDETVEFNACGVSGSYCFLGSIVIEEYDEGFGLWDSDATKRRKILDEARSDAADILYKCIDERHYSLHAVATCINNDVANGYELSSHDICHSDEHQELRSELREGGNRHLLYNCK